ncbi:MAG: hypothetical protein ACK5MT_01735 [Actinomycetales bacterium]
MTALNDELLHALQEFERVGLAHGVEGFTALAPGITASEVEDTLGPLGLTPHPDLLTYYTWHNDYLRAEPGSGHLRYRGINDPALFVATEHMPLAYARRIYEALGLGREEAFTCYWPIFGDSLGQIVLNCSTDGPDTGTVHIFDNVSDFEGYDPAPNLLTIIKWWTHWLDTGQVRWNNTPGLFGWYNDLTPDTLTPLQRATGMAFLLPNY